MVQLSKLYMTTGKTIALTIWRSLVGYRPRGCRESDTTERLHLHLLFTEYLLYSRVTKRGTFVLVLKAVLSSLGGLPRWPSGKESSCQCR